MQHGQYLRIALTVRQDDFRPGVFSAQADAWDNVVIAFGMTPQSAATRAIEQLLELVTADRRKT